MGPLAQDPVEATRVGKWRESDRLLRGQSHGHQAEPGHPPAAYRLAGGPGVRLQAPGELSQLSTADVHSDQASFQ